MKKAQVSFEYILLFAFVFLVFITLASFFAVGMQKTDSAEALAQKLAKNVKVKIITASLSEADFESTVFIPQNINGRELEVKIIKDPDNLLTIKDKEQGITLATSFLPLVKSVNIDDTTINQYTLVIKKENNEITLSEETS